MPASETEVEAAARALHDEWGWSPWPDDGCEDCIGYARAALAAAERVRAGDGVILGREFVTVVNDASPARVPHGLPANPDG